MMTQQRILVVGRRVQVMLRVQELLESAGYEHAGALSDSEALELMNTFAPDALLVGGGVEEPSRAALIAAFKAAHPGRPVIEHFGGAGGLLEHVSQALGEAS